MTLVDVLKAAGVALAVMLLTMLLSFPMVAFYAYVIEPGHPREFYTAAAQEIAPWSSHIFGPLLFLGFCYRAGRRRTRRQAIRFAIAAIVFYVVLDAGSLPLFGLEMRAFFSAPVLVSLVFKTAGALLGAWLATRRAVGKPSTGATLAVDLT